MTALVSLLVFCQAIGASFGAILSIWGEFAYIRAMRDGQLGVAERAHLASIGLGLRIGMALLLIASLGLVVVAYILHASPQPALTPTYWTFVMVALLIIGVSWALSHRHISFSLGSATLFTAWWFLSYLTIGWMSPLPFPFGSAIALLVVATGVIYGLFYYLRYLASRLARNVPQP